MMGREECVWPRKEEEEHSTQHSQHRTKRLDSLSTTTEERKRTRREKGTRKIRKGTHRNSEEISESATNNNNNNSVSEWVRCVCEWDVLRRRFTILSQSRNHYMRISWMRKYHAPNHSQKRVSQSCTKKWIWIWNGVICRTTENTKK